MDELTLLIVADDPLTRAGLAAVLADLPAVSVAGTSDSRGDIAALLDLHQPDLLMWDLGWDLEGQQGEEMTALERLTDAVELDVPVLALVADGNDARVVWHTGVHGLMPRSVSSAALAAALPAIAARLHVLEPSFTAALVAPLSSESRALIEPLTPREQEVLSLLAEGLTNRAIGRALEISEHTAKFHVQALMGKLGAQSRTEAVVRATRLGLLTL